jgi:hypothetical protein
MHSLQHLSFLGTALLFWWTIFKVRGSELGYGTAVFYLFATALQTGALGALLTFAPHLWYPAYAATTAPWGLTPLEDQQLAGLVMWVPMGTLYTCAGLFFAHRWLSRSRLAGAPAPLSGTGTSALMERARADLAIRNATPRKTKSLLTSVPALKETQRDSPQDSDTSPANRNQTRRRRL